MKEKIKRPPATEKNLQRLKSVEKFYEQIGGVAGYHKKVLELMEQAVLPPKQIAQVPITPLDIACQEAGIEALPQLAEIYPLGGLGSRLALRGARGELLPAAALSFCGHTLLEGLVRDVAGREYLYFKRTGKKIVTPIALMASDEAHNFPYIMEICEKANWFGRGRENFRIFKQPSVPVITREGEWLLENGELVCQPNGHGALWQMALQEGIFDWFLSLGRDKLLIRQINNPIAGIDDLLLSFVGCGVLHNKTFGFAACERPKGVQEGMLALIDEKHISNIEYTDLEKFEIEDTGFLANTNILFADLNKLLPVMRRHPLPGLMVNLKGGGTARLESMMQSMSDALPATEVFVTQTPRYRTISSAKKRYVPGESIVATPVGAYYDYMRNAHELLERCHFELPPFPTVEEYLEKGMPYTFRYIPSLGPLYSEIEKKLKGGRLAPGSTLIIEHPEVYIENLDLDGTLVIDAPFVWRS